MAIAILEYRNPDTAGVVHLVHGHGFLVKWDRNEEPQFYVYDKGTRLATRTSDFSEFSNKLQEIPSGATVDRIEKCGGPFSWGMPDEAREKLATLIESKGFHMAGPEDGNFGICTCESTKVRLLSGKR